MFSWKEPVSLKDKPVGVVPFASRPMGPEDAWKTQYKKFCFSWSAGTPIREIPAGSDKGPADLLAARAEAVALWEAAALREAAWGAASEAARAVWMMAAAAGRCTRPGCCRPHTAAAA